MISETKIILTSSIIISPADSGCEIARDVWVAQSLVPYRGARILPASDIKCNALCQYRKAHGKHHDRGEVKIQLPLVAGEGQLDPFPQPKDKDRCPKFILR